MYKELLEHTRRPHNNEIPIGPLYSTIREHLETLGRPIPNPYNSLADDACQLILIEQMYHLKIH